jgi:hypothetical protein
MYWKEFLKPTPSRLVITALLAIFFVSSMPFISVHISYCDENGDNCSYQNSVTSFSGCLRIDFREEQSYRSGSRGVNRRSVRECNKLDLL